MRIRGMFLKAGILIGILTNKYIVILTLINY
jgi:hypothetical protein